MSQTMKTNILSGLLLVFVVVVGLGIVHRIQTKSNVIKENYTDLFSAKDYGKGNWVSRPTFRADLSPRFDSTRMSGGNILGSFPGMSVQSSPLTPVESLTSVQSPNYATMGGNNSAYSDARLPSGGLTTSQVNNILSNKFGRGVSDTQEYVDPKELLPVPDMKKALARDPSDPNTFMYDRYLFAPLKRRYGNVGVDFIRGDLAIPQLRLGWMDVNPVAKQDLQAGYFSSYMDVQQSTMLKDSIFERKATPAQENIPFSRLGNETIYSVL